MPQPNEYRFRITSFTPDTIPMARLAEYMAELAKVLGEPSAVHFVRVEPSSVAIVQKVDTEAQPKVFRRVRDTRAGNGPPEAMSACRRINTKLQEDNGIGELEAGGEKVLEFRGAEELSDVMGPFFKEGSLDGVPIKIGGVDEVVPIHLQSGAALYRCSAVRAVAARIAQHIFKTDLRVYGRGRWSRNKAGEWTLEKFKISEFEALDDTPLTEVVARLRAIPGSEWDGMDDPWAELRRLRGHEGSVQ